MLRHTAGDLLQAKGWLEPASVCEHSVKHDWTLRCVRPGYNKLTHRQECDRACPYFNTQAGLALLHFEETSKLRNQGEK